MEHDIEQLRQYIASHQHTVRKGQGNTVSVNVPGMPTAVILSLQVSYIGLKGEISCQEADDNATVDAEESIVQGSESEYKSLDAKNDPPPDAMLNQERNLSQGAQGGSLQNKAPELKEVSVMEAPSVAFENRAPLGIAETSTIPGDPEEEEDMNNVLSRASLQPIAEEPPCDSDSSTDTVCLASESEAGSEVKEAQQQVLDWPNKDQEEQSNAMLEACLSQSHPYNINAAAELTDDAGAKSLVPEADGSWLDGFVSILETPSVPESAVGKLESVPVGVLPPSPSKAGVITGDILNGEMDLSLQFDEPTKRGDASSEVLGSEPVTEKLEMKIEDEVDFLKDLREHAVSEGTLPPLGEEDLLKRRKNLFRLRSKRLCYSGTTATVLL
ncbi:hypothetical protein UY3_07604 [Chelonia mydas]|uniref:Uncharacterized protein n=1 Tax=Chelonia mydas TaxID=8469 RepID=M7BHW3_CHEMY|nr:hypothetical protein UY3_07604 [Chelonia mydas]